MSGWASGPDIAALRPRVLDAWGSSCWLCGEPIDLTLPFTHPFGLSLDHAVPRSKGGDDSVANLRPAHRRCNVRRGNRHPRAVRVSVIHPAISASIFPSQGRRSTPHQADSLSN